MNSFVLIFRQEKPLSPSQLEERAEATRHWAGPLNAKGHNLLPRLLTPESHWSASEGRTGTTPPSDGPQITALLFIEAMDFAQAVEIARAHPAVAFGASVEVRAWAPAAPPPVPSP